MNYTEVLLLVEPYLKKVDIENFKKIDEMYLAKSEIFTVPFYDILDKVFRKTIEKQKSNEKDSIAYIYFSVLYSNILMEKHALRIDLYDKNNVCDSVEITDEWKPNYIFDMYSDAMSQIAKILSSNYVYIEPFELKKLYKSYVMNYYLLALVLLKRMLPQIQQMESYKLMNKESKVKIVYGEYMDRGEIIYCIDNVGE